MARESIEVLKECEAFLEGHFLLSSGRHSGAYCQMAYLQQYPDKCAEVMAHVAEKLKDTDVDVIVGPAMGGIVYAYELGRQLGKRAIFTERENNVMTLRRGFEIQKGEKVLITEDVVTTGKSSMETAKVIEELGGEVVGIACIVDRRVNEIFCPWFIPQCSWKLLPTKRMSALCAKRIFRWSNPAAANLINNILSISALHGHRAGQEKPSIFVYEKPQIPLSFAAKNRGNHRSTPARSGGMEIAMEQGKKRGWFWLTVLF